MSDNGQRYETILTERIGGVLRITLNRPERRNAMSWQLRDELFGAVQVAQRDKDVRAIIIRGAGPSFCAGYDINPAGRVAQSGEYVRMSVEDDTALCISIAESWRQIWNCRVPVIAQVHGHCLAGGTDLAFHCDMVIAADDAQFGFPPVRSQGGPPTHMWLYNCGPQWSKRLLLTGDSVSGSKAAEIGLVLESVPADELDDHVLELATRIANIGHDLLVHNKRIVNLGVELMGRGPMQVLAAIHDVLGHNAPEAADFNSTLRRDGVRATIAERDAPFVVGALTDERPRAGGTMDRTITEEQTMLLEASNQFIDDMCPLTAVRSDVSSEAAFRIGYRRQAAALGWFSMLVPERLGGGNLSGNGLVDAALIAFRRGRVLQPGTFVGTNVVAFALSEAGDDTQQTKVLANLISGEESATWVVGAPAVHGSAGGSVRATASDGAYVLSGSATFVQDAAASDWLLVTAETEGGTSQFLVPSGAPNVTAGELGSLDISRHFGVVQFDATEVDASTVVGRPGEADDLVARQLAIACVLTAAETVGAMDRDFEVALQYAKDRIAFGRPIGSFQAIKHLLADTSLMLEMSKAITLAAAETAGRGDDYGLQAASMAKAFVGDCGMDLGQNCFQVFGGIGFTWEHDQHLYLRRIAADAALYGDSAWHREHLCQLSGL